MKIKMKFSIVLLILTLTVSCVKDDSLESIDLAMDWRFSPDEKNIGLTEKWFDSDFDDSQWATLDAGKRWEDQGYPNLDGYAWYRKTVDIPKEWKGKDVWIKFGGVNDAYTLYVNGKDIGFFNRTADMPSFTKISPYLKYGETNLLVLQVNDWGNSGGLWRLPIIITTDKKENNLFKPLSDIPFSPEKENYELFWEDEFNGDRLDTKKWRHRALGPRRGGFGTPDAVEVKDGFLKIRAYMENDTLKVGAISTEGIKGFKYGYFECKAKLPKTTGPWAAFWIQSSKISQGEDPAKFGTEIDIFEYFKDQGGDLISHNLHWAYGPNQKSSGALLSKVDGIGEGFHTFSAEWTPEKYVFYVDGLKYHEYQNAISNIEESIIVSFEACSEDEVKTATLPDTFIVDYVKVYKKK